MAMEYKAVLVAPVVIVVTVAVLMIPAPPAVVAIMEAVRVQGVVAVRAVPGILAGPKVVVAGLRCPDIPVRLYGPGEPGGHGSTGVPGGRDYRGGSGHLWESRQHRRSGLL